MYSYLNAKKLPWKGLMNGRGITHQFTFIGASTQPIAFAEKRLAGFFVLFNRDMEEFTAIKPATLKEAKLLIVSNKEFFNI